MIPDVFVAYAIHRLGDSEAITALDNRADGGGGGGSGEGGTEEEEGGRG